MKRRSIGAALAALLLVGCATGVTSTSKHTAYIEPKPAPAKPHVDIVKEAGQLRTALEDAYSHIETRSTGTETKTVVDADASLSMAIPDHRSIRGAINYFSTDLHDSIQISLLRAGHYRPMIESVLDEYRLPRGLAYLPVIESAYVPTLTSRAGAHGIWQFMPETAREYGLRVDWWVDERADAEKETRAAAAYLRDLYSSFGDWSLALAAYNAGPGRIHRAMSDTGAASFWALLDADAVPKETRGYVPTFFATLVIVSDPPTYGFSLKETPAADRDVKVEIEGPVTLDYLAEVAELDASLVRDRNPQFKHAVLPPGRSSLYLPKNAAAKLTARAGTLRSEDPNLSIASFTLRDGDSLRSIAKKIGSTADELEAMNRISRNDVRQGDTIYLPVRQRELSSLLRSSAGSASRYYTVKHGDTLYSIARSHGLTLEELTDLNELSDHHVLHTGERIRVSTGTALTAGGM